jgi:magnesium-transporting ATPase (P-type)
MMLDRCKRYVNAEGEDELLTPEICSRIVATQEKLGGGGERVLALCRKELNTAKYTYDYTYKADEVQWI